MFDVKMAEKISPVGSPEVKGSGMANPDLYRQKLPMRYPALDSGYIFDGRHIWIRSDYGGICYSDGDQVEQRIAGIINNTCDLSVLSAELASHCKDWPSLYHLSRRRANLLRPLENQLQNASVLEVGAGCGAISRYMGEVGAQVLALEGSPYRASIAASRCRNLANVTVVADAFHLFEPVQRFDVVTLIGVLEYARKFFPSSGGDPVDAMLARARNFLKPGGKLIIAIENQLGLKYFAGFPEDHTGKPMFGIEDHYGADSVVTFGRRELGERAAKAGLAAQQWWYPFPDYKLPTLLISEAGVLPQGDFDLTSVVRSACAGDSQYPDSVSFNQARAWRAVVHNELLRDMANSFLLLASDREFPQQENLPLAVHYSTERRPEFAKKVVFERKKGTEDCSVMTHHLALSSPAVVGASSVLQQHLIDQPFLMGELWHDRLVHIMTAPEWKVEQIREWFQTWLSAFCVTAGLSNCKNLAERAISGEYIDAIPRNLLIDRDGVFKFIDQEWVFSRALNVGYLSFRALLTSFLSIGIVAKPFEHKYLKIPPLLTDVLRSINVDLNENNVKFFLDLEGELDQLASGKSAFTKKELISWFESLELRMFDTQTPVHEKLAQCGEQLAVIQDALAQRERELKDVLESSSWRLTRPLRTLGKWLTSQTRP
jgi:SAM-dependent methyltransferase